MHDGMPYGQNQGQGQGHSREVDRQSPTGLIFIIIITTPKPTVGDHGMVYSVDAESAIKCLSPTPNVNAKSISIGKQ